MPQQKNPSKNLYQIGVIIGVIVMIIYGFSLYNAARLHQSSRMYWDIAVMAAWFILTVYWLRQLGKLAKKENEKEK